MSVPLSVIPGYDDNCNPEWPQFTHEDHIKVSQFFCRYYEARPELVKRVRDRFKRETGEDLPDAR